MIEAKNKIYKIDGMPIFTKTDEGILELVSSITHNFMHPKGKKAKNLILVSNLRNILSISNQLFLHNEIKEIVLYSERELQKLLNADKVRIYLKEVTDMVKESTYFDKKFISLTDMNGDGDEKVENHQAYFYDKKENKVSFGLDQGIIGNVIRTGVIKYVKDIFNDIQYNCKFFYFSNFF